MVTADDRRSQLDPTAVSPLLPFISFPPPLCEEERRKEKGKKMTRYSSEGSFPAFYSPVVSARVLCTFLRLTSGEGFTIF